MQGHKNNCWHPGVEIWIHKIRFFFCFALINVNWRRKGELDGPAVGCMSKQMKAQMETPGGSWPLQGEEYKRERGARVRLDGQMEALGWP